MIIVNHGERVKIDNGEKRATLRAIRASGKGYFKVGSLQMFCEGRDFKNGIFNRGLILNRSFISISELTESDFKCLGYDSKAEYMAQPYNKGNPSSERVRYDFITLSDLLEFVQSLEFDPEAFFMVWDMVKDCRELAQGVNPSLIFEGCDPEDIESEIMAIESNIEGAIL